jgi:hypothetical protein
MTLGFLRETTRVEKRSMDGYGGEGEPHALVGPAGRLAPPYTDSMDFIDPLATCPSPMPHCRSMLSGSSINMGRGQK